MFGSSTSTRFTDHSGANLPGPGAYDVSTGLHINNNPGVGLHSSSHRFAAIPQDDNKGKFACDFVSAWTKVMNLDRFDL